MTAFHFDNFDLIAGLNFFGNFLGNKIKCGP